MPARIRLKSCLKTLAAALTLAGLAACATLAPPARAPAPRAADSWYAPLPHGGQVGALDSWWQTFHDDALLELQRAAQHASPALEQALAAIRSARAGLVITGADTRPRADLQSSVGRSGDLHESGWNVTSSSHALDASWEIDLFGRNREAVAALEDERDARSAEWHAARVSLAAEVATDYVDYRACRQLLQAYRNQEASYRKTLALTRTQVDAGLAPPADFRLTAAGAAGAAAGAVAQATRCETLLKSLVALAGLPEPRVRLVLGQDAPVLPQPWDFSVNSVPADLLRQRPDLAAADHRAAAAYARVAVSQAARWPRLTLIGSIGVAHAPLIAPSPWSLAPALTLPLFSAGADAARVDAARADYAVAVADFEARVRDAVREVESALVNLDGAARQAQQTATSADHYRAYFQAAEINWQAGRLPALDLETARRNALGAELLDIQVGAARVAQWIALYKALGGGWNQDLNHHQEGEQP